MFLKQFWFKICKFVFDDEKERIDLIINFEYSVITIF
jgi:hypothetical protein